MANFITISSTRSGSTMLDSAFNNCNDISSFGECISVRELNPYFFTNHKDPVILKLRRWHNDHSLYTWYKNNYINPLSNISNIIEDLIPKWLDWLFTLDDSVSFKVLWNHCDIYPCLVDILNKRDIKVIYIKRNPVSRIKSMRNKFAHVKDMSDDELLRETELEQEDLKKWFPNRLDITFEELTGDKDTREFPYEITNKIFDYLELPYQLLRPMIKKTIIDKMELKDK